MSNSDRPTDPDARSPYEHILSELNEIKALCAATNDRQWFTVVASAAAFVVAACSYAHG